MIGGRRSVDRGMLLRVLSAHWVAFLVVCYLQDWSFDLSSLPRRMLVALFGIGLCWLMYLVLERADPRGTAVRLAWVLGLSAPLTVVFAGVSVLAFYFSMPTPSGVCALGQICTPRALFMSAVNYGASFLFLFIAWGATYIGMRSAALGLEAERNAGRARDEARIAQLRALHYQVNPHFLFNCLNSLGTLVDRGDVAAARTMINEMGGFLRYGLAIDPLMDVELTDEIEMQRRYLEIERLRFAHRLVIAVSVDDAVRRALIPSLLLQPLVENAIKHGVATTSASVTVALRAYPDARGRLTVIVEDDAPLNRSAASDRIGIGQRNVGERLDARFGEEATLVSGPRPGGGYRSEISMPMVRS